VEDPAFFQSLMELGEQARREGLEGLNGHVDVGDARRGTPSPGAEQPDARRATAKMIEDDAADLVEVRRRTEHTSSRIAWMDWLIDSLTH